MKKPSTSSLAADLQALTEDVERLESALSSRSRSDKKTLALVGTIDERVTRLAAQFKTFDRRLAEVERALRSRARQAEDPGEARFPLKR
jgi:peptidoglycan hydrolase CwlO-like protein